MQLKTAVDISFDPAKQASNLAKHGLDLANAGAVFTGKFVTRLDGRFDCGEDRFITAGYLKERCVIVVWTWRGTSRRIISLRFANASEENRWF